MTRSQQMDDALYQSIVEAPLLPTVYPMAPEKICKYVDALTSMHYPALEMLARPPHEAFSTLKTVFQGSRREAVKWGIGTVRTREVAQQAAALKPDFLVSPAFSRRVLEVAVEAAIPYIPAISSFQDVQDVLDAFDQHGLKVRLLKLCPVYGVTSEWVRSLCGCFPGIVYCPTGEVTLENYPFWKGVPGIVAPMGSRLVPSDLIEAGDSDAIQARLKLFQQLSQQADL